MHGGVTHVADIAHVHTIQLDAAALGLIEALDHGDDGGLATTAVGGMTMGQEGKGQR